MTKKEKELISILKSRYKQGESLINLYRQTNEAYGSHF